MVAHRSQLFAIPDAVSNEVAVLLEPFACAIHAAKRAAVAPGETVLVVGAGTVGILTLMALKLFAEPGHVIVAAKHEKQRAAARLAGADEVVRPEHTTKAVRRHTSAVKLTPERGQEFLLGGADVVLECTGSKSALDMALRTAKAGGRVVVSGIPGAGADLTPLWFRELELVGAYTATADDFATRDPGGAATCRTWSSSSAPRIRSPAGATRSTTRCRPARSARSRSRSDPKTEETDRPCHDQGSCSRWTSGHRRCSSTRARATACRSSRSAPG